MKWIRILVVIVAVIVALLVLSVFALTRYLQTAAFKQTVLTAAGTALGSDIEINDLSISLFSGVTLHGVAISNPSGFDGNLLTADRFVLRYRLLPLLQRRMNVQQLSLEKPVVNLVRNADGDWNYEKMGDKLSSDPDASSSTPAERAGSSKTPVDIALSSLEIENGEIVMWSEKHKELVRMENLDISSSINVASTRMSGTGRASIETLNLADSLFVRRLTSLLTISEDEVKLAPISGQCAGGTVSGELILNLAGGSLYKINLQIENSDISKLLEEAGSKKNVMTGKLQATATLEGTAGLPTLTGNGKVEILEGRLLNIPLLNLLANLLQVNDLRELKFDECLLEFRITNNVMQTPVIQLSSPKVKITGKGSVSLEDYSLNHDMTLAVEPSVLDNAPKEIRSLFTEREDGFLALDFRVSGPYDAPKTDLIKNALNKLLDKGLKKLFD